ncbi:MAG TPA: type II toxin-antitoxin system HicB family antitoxin [Abditibacteriaceae bacterium]|jgi:predicted RNase H-like HicB family nuclease
MNHKYETVIWWSEEDQLFLAKAPELPGCMAHGETRDEAWREIHNAMDLWLEVAQEHGDPIPQPKGELVPV